MKKLSVWMLAVVMTVACVFGMAACGGKDDFDGQTYVVYQSMEEGDAKIAYSVNMEYSFKDGKVTAVFNGKEEDKKADYKVDGNKLTLTADGKSFDFVKKDNYYIGTEGEMASTLICKKGTTPKGYTVKSMSIGGDE